MSDNPVQLFVASYDNEVGAQQSLQDFQTMHRQGSIDLIDAVTLEGKVRFEETADPSGKKWAKRGAIAAIIAIAEDHVLDDLQRGIEGYERIARHAMSAEAVVAITAVASGEDGGGGGDAPDDDESAR